MNIFYLSHDPKQAAQWQVDRHCVKMILESCQLLCTAFHLQGHDAPYKATHTNHPSAIWCRESSANFKWLLEHTYELFLEYAKRYDKLHKSIDTFRWCIQNAEKLTFPKSEFTSPPLAMPDEYKHSDPVIAYRRYYKYGKSHLHQWKMNKPEWIDDNSITL